MERGGRKPWSARTSERANELEARRRGREEGR